ncbi:MAG: imidazole glycerol phosphate synthase subunit HisH [Dehalococcoidia bacterium]
MDQLKVAIVDYEAGNLRSVQKAIEACGSIAKITTEAEDINSCDGIILPGQGASDSAMSKLNELGLSETIKNQINKGKPFLGICLGLQLLFDSSEEGDLPGLGLIQGRIKKFSKDSKVPHIGWNQVSFNKNHPFIQEIPNQSNFYFAHSYFSEIERKKQQLATTDYGIEFCSAVAIDNLVAVQFHPEKSGILGLGLYKNFLNMIIHG